MKLRYTLPALADLGAAHDYVAVHSPQGAKRIQARIQKTIDLLVQYPHIGVRTDDPVIRRVTTAPYRYLRNNNCSAAYGLPPSCSAKRTSVLR
ncbi:MAG TPA: type II toxin-antitoxin system RelE/ParE family toxin [Xanthobacteraceae bacterium]|nr:type II toxin-antitoxin system RelE/ParE family toxin [Xanthobacteraceae bacterium]